MSSFASRKPLCTIVPKYFLLPRYSIGEVVGTFCRSSIMASVQSFELDDNCHLVETLTEDKLRFGLATRLTHVRISLWNFNENVSIY